jgi:protein-disulfide isomerase
MWWVVGAVIVAAVVVGVLVQRSRSATEHATVTHPTSAVGPHGGVLVGDANAPVTITEYGDFQCPGCDQLHQLWEPTLEQLIQQGKVKFEFVGLEFLDRGTTESLRSAAAATCAADAGKFLDYYNTLYDQQSPTENSGFLTNERLLSFGSSAGITDSAFARCVSSGRFTGWVTKNTDVASQRGVSSTPTVLMNDKEISGADAADPARLTALVNQAAGQG